MENVVCSDQEVFHCFNRININKLVLVFTCLITSREEAKTHTGLYNTTEEEKEEELSEISDDNNISFIHLYVNVMST